MAGKKKAPSNRPARIELYPAIKAAAQAGLLHVDPDWAVTPCVGAPLEVHDELETIGGKIEAYRALGPGLVAVDPALSWRARQLASIFEIVGGSDEAPQPMIDVARELTEQWLRGQATGVDSWALVLEGIFQCAIVVDPGDRQPAPRTRAVLASLRASVDGETLPPAMRKPTAKALQQAEKAITTRTTTETVRERSGTRTEVRSRPLQITHGKAGGRGGRVNAWGAAALFAAAFGVTLPAKKSDTLRTNKSPRRRRPNTSR